MKAEKKKIKEKYKETLVELVDTKAMDLWEFYNNAVLKPCDELCEWTKGWGDQENTRWGNEQVNDAIDGKEKAFEM